MLLPVDPISKGMYISCCDCILYYKLILGLLHFLFTCLLFDRSS
jgi:hypothetical protein